MKLTDYVYRYHIGCARRGSGKQVPKNLHGNAFYKWFDKEFGLETI